MYPIYEKKENDFEIYTETAEHIPPHLHNAFELIILQSGTLAVGLGPELHLMEAGDVALIFPDIIHHYQVFDANPGQVTFLHADATLVPAFSQILTTKSTKDPIIKKNDLPVEVAQGMEQLSNLTRGAHHIIRNASGIEDPYYRSVLLESYLQILLARLLPMYELVDKESMGSDDIIYRVVEYIARNYINPITLTSMAENLYVSQFALSRIFSSTFHMNFNRYLNQTRLRHFRHLMQYSDQTITEAAFNSGFESQRTFNRVFQEEFHMSPSEWKKSLLK